MTDSKQPDKDDDVPAVVRDDLSKPTFDAQRTANELNAWIDSVVTKFRRRPSLSWNTAINLFMAVVVTIGTGVGVASLRSLNRSVDEMAKQTPEIIKSAKAAEDAAIAARDAAESARIQAEASRTQADASLLQAQAAVAGTALAEQQVAAANLQALAAARANQLAEQARSDSLTAERRSQRARVSFLGFRVTMQPPTDVGFKVRADYINDGRTIAERFITRHALSLSTTTPAVPEWTKIPASEGTLAPGVKGRYMETEIPWNPPQQFVDRYLDRTSSPRTRLYVWFRYEYSDSGRRHWMQTCMYHLSEMAAQAFASCGTGTTTQSAEDGDTDN